MKQLTVRDIPRLSGDDATKLARDVVTNRGLLTSNANVVNYAFAMLLSMMPMTKAASAAIGALYGSFDEIVPGMGMNGYPIFLSVKFVHKKDLAAVNAEIDRMWIALGVDNA